MQPQRRRASSRAGHRCGLSRTPLRRPVRQPTALSGWPSNSEDSWISSDYAERGRTRLCDKAIDCSQAADHGGRRGAETAGMRNVVAAAHHHAGSGDPRGLQPPFDGPHHQMVRGSTGTCPAPSPSTSTTKPESVVSTMISSQRLSARPRLSKPGPRLALDAATTAVAVSPAGRVCVTRTRHCSSHCSRRTKPTPASRQRPRDQPAPGTRLASPSARCRDP